MPLSPRPGCSRVEDMGLTLRRRRHLLTGKALPTCTALALAAGTLEYGLPIVEAGPTAAGIEFHQVLVQGPAQVLPFGLQRPQVCVPQQLVDGLHLQVQEELGVSLWLCSPSQSSRASCEASGSPDAEASPHSHSVHCTKHTMSLIRNWGLKVCV